MRNYKKEYENYHSRPEQKIRRAARNAARKRFSNADPTLDVHHKDNDPLNNDLNNLSLVTQHYNRKEPRLREKKLKDLKSKLTAALRQTTEDAVSRAQDVVKLKKKHAGEKEAEKAAIKKVKKDVKEGLTDPQELAKEIEWGISPKNVDSRALSTKQKKQMKDIVKLMQRSKAPNWVSKFTQVYFTSDKLVQQRLKSAAKRGGMSPELMKKLFKEGLAVLPKGGFRNQFEPEITAWEKKLGKKIKKKLSPEMKKDLMKFLKQKYGSAARHFKIPDVIEGVDGDAMIDLMQKYLLSKNPKEKKTLLKQINRYQKKLGLKVTEDMGSVTGAHIAGTGDDNTVHTKPKKRRLAKRLRKYGLK